MGSAGSSTEEYLVMGLLALVIGCVLYYIFTGSVLEFFEGDGLGRAVDPSTCTWAPATTSTLPSMGINDFLSGYEYLTVESAKADCAGDPKCTGIVGTTRTENVTEQNGVQHNVTRTYWKMSKSSSTSPNTNQNIQFIAKVSCASNNNVSPTNMCTYETGGMRNTDAYGNKLNTQFRTLLDAKVGCSGDASCRGIVQKPDDFFYLSDTSRTTGGMDGYKFFAKLSCPTVCEYEAGEANTEPDGNTFTEQYTNMTDAQVACSSENRCMGVVKDKNDVFYMSSTDDTKTKNGFTFHKKKRDTCTSGGGGGGGGGEDRRERREERREERDEERGEEWWVDWWRRQQRREERGDESRVIPPVGPPPGWIDSTLGRMDGEYSWMTGGNGERGERRDDERWWKDLYEKPGDAYIRKSSLVPCTCTTHSMGCERHGGGIDSSIVPGDLDGNFQYRTQPQSDVMRPFSQAFLNQGEPTGFLNSFSAFG